MRVLSRSSIAFCQSMFYVSVKYRYPNHVGGQDARLPSFPTTTQQQVCCVAPDKESVGSAHPTMLRNLQASRVVRGPHSGPYKNPHVRQKTYVSGQAQIYKITFYTCAWMLRWVHFLFIYMDQAFGLGDSRDLFDRCGAVEYF